MKNILVIFLIVIFAGGAVYATYTNNRKPVVPAQPAANAPQITPQTPPDSASEDLVGNDADEHGCIGSAGYSWCEAKQKCLRSWEEACDEAQDSELIKAALFKKNNWTDDGITVKVSTNDGKYAKGTVNSVGGGGLFFAAKVNGNWEIVADGNGIISCDSLKNYPDYPPSLIPSCHDVKTGELVQR